MLPQLLEAKKRNMGVLVMNPNKSVDEEGNRINFCNSMPMHASYVWHRYVLSSGIKRVYLIAHSAGGWCTTQIIRNYKELNDKASPD